MPSVSNYSLSLDEVAHFHDYGFLGPFASVLPDEMAAIRVHIDEEVLTRDGAESAHARAIAAHGFQSSF